MPESALFSPAFPHMITSTLDVIDAYHSFQIETQLSWSFKTRYHIYLATSYLYKFSRLPNSHTIYLLTTDRSMPLSGLSIAFNLIIQGPESLRNFLHRFSVITKNSRELSLSLLLARRKNSKTDAIKCSSYYALACQLCDKKASHLQRYPLRLNNKVV